MSERTGVETVEILLTDLEDTRQILAACATYFTANDIAQAQLQLGKMRQSSLTGEIERIQSRLDGIFGDWLLIKYQEERDEEGDSDGEDNVEGDRPEEEEEEEELVAEPLGTFRAPRQVGRRLDGITAEMMDA